MVTLKDVAARAGVSIASVSNALNRRGKVSQEVADRILIAAAELGYQPDRTARALRTGVTHTLGLILPDLANPFFPRLAQAASWAARSAGYALLMIDASEDVAVEDEAFRTFESRRVDGAIWCPIRDTSPPDRTFPIVVVDRPIGTLDAVNADFVRGGKLIADYLIRMGLRRYGLLSGPVSIGSARARHEGFIAAASGNLERVWEVETAFSHDLTPDAQEALARLNIDVVVAGNDTIAIGALSVLRRLGRVVPDDVAVVGFDDIDLAGLVDPPLTTVRQPIAKLGEEAVSLLLKRIENPGLGRQHIVLDVELVERASSNRRRT